MPYKRPYGYKPPKKKYGGYLFERLPCELVENIVVFLEIADICSLRLTNTILATKSTQDHFIAYLRRLSKRVVVDKPNLDFFAAATQMEDFSCCLEHLTLVGHEANTDQVTGMRDIEFYEYPFIKKRICYWDYRVKDPDFTTSEKATEALKKAFLNITQNGQTGGVKSLTLSAYSVPLSRGKDIAIGPNLQTLKLSDLNTCEEDLLGFLREHSEISSLTLERVKLFQGRWSNVFAYCKSEVANLHSLSFSYLQEPVDLHGHRVWGHVAFGGNTGFDDEFSDDDMASSTFAASGSLFREEVRSFTSWTSLSTPGLFD